MDNILNFYSDINKLKHSERNGWKWMGVKGVKDTIASHSFGATMIGWVLSKAENISVEKIMKLLLTHDLIMAHMPDLVPGDQDYSSKKLIEQNAKNDLISNIPDELKLEFSDLFDEYNSQESEESKLAREADKLDTLFQAYLYSKELGVDKFKVFLNNYKSYFKSKTGKKLYDDLSKKSI